MIPDSWLLLTVGLKVPSLFFIGWPLQEMNGLSALFPLSDIFLFFFFACRCWWRFLFSFSYVIWSSNSEMTFLWQSAVLRTTCFCLKHSNQLLQTEEALSSERCLRYKKKETDSGLMWTCSHKMNIWHLKAPSREEYLLICSEHEACGWETDHYSQMEVRICAANKNKRKSEHLFILIADSSNCHI